VTSSISVRPGCPMELRVTGRTQRPTVRHVVNQIGALVNPSNVMTGEPARTSNQKESTMPAFNTADHVWVDLGADPFIAHVLGYHDDGKVIVQKPDGTRAVVAHREPADRDKEGSGSTCWTV
jgi:hypothetical protein